MNKLRQMSIFAHIVDEGSISAAADKLSLSKSVVSQHLKSLETDLGTVLLKRTTRRQLLTEVGKAFYHECQKLNAIADFAWKKVGDSQLEPQGKIRITAPNVLMDSIISPIIAKLMVKYPKLKPELISDDQYVDLMEQDIDLAIRVGYSKDSNLKQRRVGGFRDILCGNKPLSKEEILALPYIANQWQGHSIEHIFTSDNGDTFTLRKDVGCRVNSFYSCFSMISAGAGIGLIPDFYLEQKIQTVIELLPGMRLPENPVFALTPYHDSLPISVSLCIEEIRKRLKTQ